MFKVHNLNHVLLGSQRKTLFWPALLIYWKLKTVNLFFNMYERLNKCSCFKQMKLIYHYYCQTRKKYKHWY